MGKPLAQPGHGLQRQYLVGENHPQPGIRSGGIVGRAAEEVQGPLKGAQRPPHPQGHDLNAGGASGIELNDPHRLGVMLLRKRIGQRRAGVRHAWPVELLGPVEMAKGHVVEASKAVDADAIHIADAELPF